MGQQGSFDWLRIYCICFVGASTVFFLRLADVAVECFGWSLEVRGIQIAVVKHMLTHGIPSFTWVSI